MNERCDQCRFSRKAEHPAPEVLECRRHAPSPSVLEQAIPGEEHLDRFSYWPLVVNNDWCGEFQANYDDPEAMHLQARAEL